ncbi:hypothetical protein NLI96_g1372 [Meripilus lineatus]|uniref:Uncharacterized protein n=1 Tax=Meripilus lineatus TaxID=2056292 RepID=A0AAD5VC67_9APHY|nr:hypothetical protein NLI96_g1372 [Physisporinus lineatus]
MQGFNAINGSELAGALQSGLTYYQLWNSSQWILNDGPQGLQRLDYVIESAGKHNIKIILAFANNWDPFHLITTGGEGQFFQKDPVKYWFNGTLVSDYNFDGQAGEDFEGDLKLPNIDFGTYHMYPQSWYPELDFPGSNFTVEEWGLENKSIVYPSWVKKALDTKHAIMPWQFGQLGLTESGGNRLIKYADAILNGASPNDGLAIYPNETTVWDVFTNAAKIQNQRSGDDIN